MIGKKNSMINSGERDIKTAFLFNIISAMKVTMIYPEKIKIGRRHWINVEISGCPSCHNMPYVYSDVVDNRWIVKCMNGDCEQQPMTYQFVRKIDAVEAWNNQEYREKGDN